MASEECQRLAEQYVGVPKGFQFRPGIVEAICHPSADLSGFPPAMVEQFMELTENDQDQILRFASMLRAAGPAPAPPPEREEG